MNNKGFAISSILYLLVLITGLLFATTLGVITFRKNVLVSKINKISSELGGNLISQYRYMTIDGEWSNWLNYQNKSDIDYSFSVNKITNTGTAGDRYDLTPTNVILEIVDGEAYLKFNGTSSRAVNTSGPGVVANTILLQVKKDNNGAIVSYNTATQQGVYYDGSNRINMRDSGGSVQTSTPTYANGNIYKYVLILDRVTGNYKIYQNGVFVGTTGATNMARFDSIGLGHLKHNNTSFFSGNIYKTIFSALIISDNEAIEMSKLSGSRHEELLSKGNANVKYGPFIEYRQVSGKNETVSNDVFKARFVRDYMAGTLSGTSNQILDINVFAKFERATKFYGVMIGGAYSGTYEKDRDHNNQVALGKIRVTGGSFTHVNTKVYTISNVMEVLTPYTSANSFGSGLLLFVGSDTTRFPPSAVNSFNGFVLANYGDINNNGSIEWYYYNGTAWVNFIVNENDAIVGYVAKNAGDSILSMVSMFSPVFTFNVALGKRITSNFGTTDINGRNISIVVDGNRQSANFFTNGTGSRYVEIDLGVEYNVTTVKLFHQHLTVPVVTLGTKTILYDNNKIKTYTLWDHEIKGLYVEDTLGNGITLHVDPNMMPNTHKTRYVQDASNGRYNLINTFVAGSTWIEIEAYDLSGYNIARGKTATTTGTPTNIAFLTDGNNTNVYSAGTGLQAVTIDLGREYAIQEVNIIRAVGDFSYLDTKTVLLNKDSNNNSIIYNDVIDGLYKEILNGIRMKKRVIVSGEDINNLPPPPMNFVYTGSEQTYNVMTTGRYRIELWGAEGGFDSSAHSVGGKGGYAYGEVNLTARQSLKVYVGSVGTSSSAGTIPGGFNGGGAGRYFGGSGGGATDVRIGGSSLFNRLIVAGGGGGANGQRSASYVGNGGSGGGITGGHGTYSISTYNGKAGTHTAGGAAGTYSSTGNPAPGTFGIGGQAGYFNTSFGAGGGGGGWYGGGGGASNYGAGGGGSGFILTSATVRDVPSGYLVSDQYYLANAITIAGNSSMPAPTGGNQTGHTGNGFARITYIGQ